MTDKVFVNSASGSVHFGKKTVDKADCTKSEVYTQSGAVYSTSTMYKAQSVSQSVVTV